MELGFWNAWLLFVCDWLPMPLLRVLRPRTLAALGGEPSTRGEHRNALVLYAVFFLGLAYALFVPFRVGTPWFYAGVPVTVAGAVLFWLAVRELMRAELGTSPLVKGAYRFSRHPLYVGEFLMFLGGAVACASVVILAYAVLVFGIHARNAGREEEECLGRYGESYRTYMRATPRWLGIPHAPD